MLSGISHKNQQLVPIPHFIDIHVLVDMFKLFPHRKQFLAFDVGPYQVGQGGGGLFHILRPV